MIENAAVRETDVADPPRCSVKGLGYLRCIATLFVWNAIPLVGTTALAVLIASEQGQELLKIDGQSTATAFEQMRKAILPLCVWVIGVTLTSMLATRAGAPRLKKIAEQHGLSSKALIPWAGLLAAIVVGYAPVVLVGVTAHAGVYAVWLTILLGVPITFPWLVQGFECDVFPPSERIKRTVAQALILALILSEAIMIAIEPAQARAVGPIGIAVVGFAFWSAMLTYLFVVIPLRLGLPSAALLAPVPWLVAGFLHDPNQFPRRSGTDAVHVLPSTGGVDEQFIRWITSANASGTESIPVYLVSAEGGGLRAAYWTCRTLTELDARTAGRFRSRTFVYSGVSGGSLGLAAYLGLADKPPGVAVDMAEAFLGRDLLSPLLGRLLVTEPFWQLLGSYGLVAPRDVAFERQWELDWTSSGAAPFFSKQFLKSFPSEAGKTGPAVIFNATNSESGKRVLLANVDFGVINNDYLFPLATHGVQETLGDLTVAEVVHLSARFPFVSPPASIQMRVPTSISGVSETKLWGRVVDGGYFDNSGGLALRDVYESLTELRIAARRGEGFSSSEPDIDWERARPLIARASFRVVVIRNDPLRSTRTERNEYPTLSGTPVAGIGGDEQSEAWKAGEYARYAPYTRSLGELLAPIETVVSTRDARASATRRGLWERIDKEINDQRYQCEIDRHISANEPMTFPIRLSAECVDAGDDRYTEISLGEDLSDSVETPSSDAFECNREDARGIALGWLLSERSKKAMSCMAVRSPTVKEISAQLGDTR